MEYFPQLEAEWRINKLCQSFSYYLDYRIYDRLTDLFTDDAEWGRVIEVHHGKQEIRRALDSRDPNIATRHFVTSFMFEHQDEKTVNGIIGCYSLFGPTQSSGVLPASFGALHGHVLDFHDVYRLTDHGWKIARRIAKAVLLEPESQMMQGADVWNPGEHILMSCVCTEPAETS